MYLISYTSVTGENIVGTAAVAQKGKSEQLYFITSIIQNSVIQK